MRSYAAPLAFAADLLCVLVFVVVGKIDHETGTAVAAVAGTAWPFLVGLAVGWLVLLAGRREPSSIGSGVLLWLATLVVGMVIRGLGDGRVPHWSFMIVAGVVTGVFLVGWRAVRAMLVRRRR